MPSRDPQISSGAFWKIYDPSVGEAEPLYINDHTIIQAQNGTWHMIGITHPEPANPKDEHIFAHATAPDLFGQWIKQPPCLRVDRANGETHLWAPHVIRHEHTYYMFYCGGSEDLTAYAINLATSTDLFTWTRAGTLFRDGWEGRDPMVLRLGSLWIMYYCGTSDLNGGNHVVLYRTSPDLFTWSERKVAYTDPMVGSVGGVTESPFVHQHDGRYYLFIGPRPSQDVYTGTDVFVSDDPLYFVHGNRVGHIHAHAAELVVCDDAEYITHCGWGQGGLFIAPLVWS